MLTVPVAITYLQQQQTQGKGLVFQEAITDSPTLQLLLQSM